MTYDFFEILSTHRWFIMGLAMISVVLYHQPWYDSGVFAFFHRIGFYGVEVFLFVSGWGIYHSLSKNSLVQYYKNRIVRMMPTCILIGIMQAIMCAFGWDNGVDHPLAYVLMCLGLFKWFVYAILLYYAIAPHVYSMMKKQMYFVGFIVFIVFSLLFCRNFESLFGAGLLSVLPNIIYRFPVFILGMCMANQKIINRHLLILSLLCLFLFFYLEYGSFTCYYKGLICSLLFTLSMPFLFIVADILNKYCKIDLLYKLVSYIGICSLEVYLWHDFFFRGFNLSFCKSSCVIIIASCVTTIVAVSFSKWVTSSIFTNRSH